jgi:hypothetical protein
LRNETPGKRKKEDRPDAPQRGAPVSSHGVEERNPWKKEKKKKEKT